jgi:hypothetical protein
MAENIHSIIAAPRMTYTLSFAGPIGAGPGVGLTRVAGPIRFRYRIKGAEVVFRNDAQNLVLVYLLVSRNNTTSPTAPPPDMNLLSPFAPTTFLIGEGLIKRVKLDYIPDSDQQYLKVHAINGCTYPQTMNATIEIEEV